MYGGGELPLIGEVQRRRDPLSMRKNKAGLKFALPPISSARGITKTSGTLPRPRSPPMTSRGDLSRSTFSALSVIAGRGPKVTPAPRPPWQLSMRVPQTRGVSGTLMEGPLNQGLTSRRIPERQGRDSDNMTIHASHSNKSETAKQPRLPPSLRSCLSRPQPIGIGTKRLLKVLAKTQQEINGTSRPMAAVSTPTTDLSELDKSIVTAAQPSTIPKAKQDSVPEKSEGWKPADETMHISPRGQTEAVQHSKAPTTRPCGIRSLRDQKVKINISTQKTPAIAPSSQKFNFLIEPPFQENRTVSSDRPVLLLKENKVCAWPWQITTDAEEKVEKENGTPNTAASVVPTASFKPGSEQPQRQMQRNRETVNIVTGRAPTAQA